MDLSIGPLAENEWSVVRALLHRAFVDEPFTVAMYGEPLPERWAGSWELYSTIADTDYDIAVGARLGGALVGVALGSRSGRCHQCQVVAREPRPDDPHLAIEWQFQQNVAAVHARLGPHALVEKVAVEPALHGSGVGRRLMAAAEAACDEDLPVELVLVCAPDRVGFYAGLGYDVVSTIADPAGPDASVMHRWIR